MAQTPTPRKAEGRPGLGEKHYTYYETIFISDVHLGSRNCNAELIERFLKFHRAKNLFIVGDLIDIWKLQHTRYWPQSHSNAVRRILSLTRKGTQVHYVLGNHDEFLKRFVDGGMARYGNLSIMEQTVYQALDGRRFLVIHGDEFDRVVRFHWLLSHLGDRLYSLVLRANRLLNAARRGLGRDYWSLSTYIKTKVRQAIGALYSFEEIITRECRERRLDGVICGHVHAAALKDAGGVAYLNCGDWVDSCTALVEHLGGRFELLDVASLMSGEDRQPALF